MIRIGGHLSIGGGLIKSLDRAQAIGANCLQIFSSSTQQWQQSTATPEDREAFRLEAIVRDIQPVFVHGKYLINLASDNPATVALSKHALINDLLFCADIGAVGVIFHLGSHPWGWERKKTSIVSVIQTVLSKTPEQTLFIIENSAGAGSKIGTTLEELHEMLVDINSPRVKVCLDTAHAFASGYDLRTKQTVDEFAQTVDRVLGWDQVVAIHLNDSKVGLGAKNDRHENIGEGEIGSAGMQAFILHPHIRRLPMLLEVPGHNRKDGPDKRNMEIVEELLTT